MLVLVDDPYEVVLNFRITHQHHTFRFLTAVWYLKTKAQYFRRFQRMRIWHILLVWVFFTFFAFIFPLHLEP